MLRLVKRKSTRQSSHENIWESDERKPELTVKEKGRKTFSFKLKHSPPKEFEEKKGTRYKDKEKKDPVILTKRLSEQENKIEKYNRRGEKNNTFNSHEESTMYDELKLLRKEVSSLKQQLAENQKKTEELKGQKNQQICALTYKLANAIRQKESAEEEIKLLKDKVQELILQLEESATVSHLRKKNVEMNESVDGASKNTRVCMSHPINDEDFSDVESVKSDDTVILCTSENLLLLQKLKSEIDKRKIEEQTVKLFTESNFAYCDAKENKDDNAGVKQIQKEIKNVRDNMTIMKGLNKKLFEDLKHFSEFQKDLLTSQSATKSQDYQCHFGAKSCEKQGSVSLSNTSSTFQNNRDEQLAGVLPRVPDFLHEGIPVLTERGFDEKSSSKTDKYVEASTKDNEIMKGKTKISYEDKIKKADERVRQLEDEDESVRQQLKKLIVNMENLRADNTEMKQELRKLSTPLGTSSEVLLKRTVFEDKPLCELKHGGEGKSHKILMAHEHIVEAAIKKTTCASPSTAVPRLKTTQGKLTISGNQINSQTSTVPEKKTAHDVSENEDETKNQSVRSNEDLPTRYKDFLQEEMNYGIQRYIVRSSETIASLRDLKPQEIVTCRGY